MVIFCSVQWPKIHWILLEPHLKVAVEKIPRHYKILLNNQIAIHNKLFTDWMFLSDEGVHHITLRLLSTSNCLLLLLSNLRGKYVNMLSNIQNMGRSVLSDVKRFDTAP